MPRRSCPWSWFDRRPTTGPGALGQPGPVVLLGVGPRRSVVAGLGVDRHGRRGAGAGHFDQGLGGRGHGGNCLRRLPLRFPAVAAVHCFRGRGVVRGGDHRFTVVPRRGTCQSGLPPLLLLQDTTCSASSPTQPHGRAPWWYYFPVLFVGGIPWVAYLPVLVQEAVNRSPNGSPPCRRPRQPAPAVPGMLVRRLHALSHGFPLEAGHLHLAGLSGDGDPGGDRLGEEDRGLLSDGANAGWAGSSGPPACSARWPCRPRRHYAGRPADAVLAVGLDAGGRGGADLFGAAMELAARPRPLDAGAGRYDRLRSTGRTAAVRISPGCRGSFRPRSGRLFQSHPGIALADPDGPGASRLGLFYLDRDLRSQLQLGQMANQDIDDPLPSPLMGGGMDRHPRAPSANGSHDYDLASLPYSGPAASGFIAAATWSRGRWSAKDVPLLK